MNNSEMKERIESIFNENKPEKSDRFIFDEFLIKLTNGKIRSANFDDGNWQTNSWVKKGILIGFRMGKIIRMAEDFFDKDTFPARNFTSEDEIRLVPGGSSVRMGAFVAKSVVIMPPSYINVGAYVDEKTMIDSHALVGSCAQIGKRVHLSAGAIIGGVLEPVNASPVIIEDDVFIGGNCGTVEGAIVKKGAIIAAG
ncbi:MAG: 2,3,4,5-tetrahydropyridine-2,6-dicarboxylate N-succinyltransferase, partial [Candidatus Cloacimonetes bacterium]|nr:2,3,4,5-tetrahydropyridine-2,6-dicarboxylate N-succinyltransferase [Candidatus Cloacimonadota bacterium]